MKHSKWLFVMILGLGIALVTAYVYRAHQQPSTLRFPGYIEANLRYIAANGVSGDLAQLNVARGQQVKAGQTLFSLEATPYDLKQQAAIATTDADNAQYQNLLTGKRPPFIQQIEAEIKQEQANLTYLKKTKERTKQLLAKNNTSLAQYDLALSEYQQSQQHLQSLQTQLRINQLSARKQEIEAAKQTLKAAKANQQLATWDQTQTQVKAPIDGIVFDTYYWPGEQIAAYRPVLALLNPHQIRLIFYVPEKYLSKLTLKQTIHFKVDGDDKSYPAIIRYISPEAEYTPPVIYSRSTRADLSYKIEASIQVDVQQHWHVGQPVTVNLAGS